MPSAPDVSEDAANLITNEMFVLSVANCAAMFSIGDHRQLFDVGTLDLRRQVEMTWNPCRESLFARVG